jgi:hypothetical protein
MRTQLIAAAAAVLFCAPALADAVAAQVISTTFTPALAGSWKSAPDEMRLTSDFDRSVWGPDARSVRTAELVLDATGEGTFTVTRRVLDAKGRAVPASTSVEVARVVVGGSRKTIATRIEHDVKVVSAVRTYPDDPGYKWDLNGLQVEIVTFEDGDRNALEVRFDTPEGRGSFWDTLRRDARAPVRRTSSAAY